jgi:TATA-binding protein-associated factor Taf7
MMPPSIHVEHMQFKSTNSGLSFKPKDERHAIARVNDARSHRQIASRAMPKSVRLAMMYAVLLS